MGKAGFEHLTKLETEQDSACFSTLLDSPSKKTHRFSGPQLGSFSCKEMISINDKPS